MAGGPVFWYSAYPATSGTSFKYFNVTGAEEQGLSLEDATALTSDGIWRLRYMMPPSLPSGTGKLVIMSSACAGSGTVVVNPKWASVAIGEAPSAVALNAEGSTSIAWDTGACGNYVQTKITLDADTLVANEIVVMDLTFEDSGTTLPIRSFHVPTIIWE